MYTKTLRAYEDEWGWVVTIEKRILVKDKSTVLKIVRYEGLKEVKAERPENIRAE